MAHLAPHEMVVFSEFSETYVQNPAALEWLGFGSEAGAALLTPKALMVTNEVVEFLVNEIMKTVRAQNPELGSELVKQMFKKFRHEEETKEHLAPPLMREQIVQVQELALEVGRELGLSEDQARLLAASLISGLTTTA